MLWMNENASQQSKKLLTKENLQLLFDSTTKLARTASTRKQRQMCSTVEVCWKFGCILLWILFYESKMDQN